MFRLERMSPSRWRSSDRIAVPRRPSARTDRTDRDISDRTVVIVMGSFPPARGVAALLMPASSHPTRRALVKEERVGAYPLVAPTRFLCRWIVRLAEGG
jgi:hypothetical protein